MAEPPERGLPLGGDLPIPSVPLFALLLGGYIALAYSSYDLFGALDIGVTFFPPAGLTLASLLLLPPRRWPVVVAAAVVGEMFVNIEHSQPFWWSLGWAAANSSEPLVGAAVVRTFVTSVRLEPRFAQAFVFGGLLAGPAVGASIGATVLAISNDLGWLSSWPDIWVGDALGVLVVAPLVLAGVASRRWALRPRQTGAALVALAVLALAGFAFFATEDSMLGYLAIPLLAWVALRFDPLGLAVVAAIVAGISTAATARGKGPWSGDDLSTHSQLGRQQFFLLLAIGGAWILALEGRRRVQAVQQAAATEVQLERALESAAQREHLDAMNHLLAALSSASSRTEVVAAAERYGVDVVGARAMVLAVERGASLDGDRPLTVDLHARVVGGSRTGVALADIEAIATRTMLDGEPRSGETRGPGDAAPAWWITLPLRSSRQVFGAAWLERETPWTDQARLRAVSVLSFVAEALDRIDASRRDRQVALTLQHALMPRARLDLGRVRAAGAYHPAADGLQVGGDWYDVSERADGTLGLIVGDLVGHGLAAAAAMGQLSSAARALSTTLSEPSEVVEALDAVALDNRDARFATMAYGVFDPASCLFRYSRAGHPPPVVRLPDGDVRFLEGGAGPPLTCTRGPRKAGSIVVPGGSVLLMYTDGLIDWHGSSIDERLDRLGEILAGITTSDPSDVVTRVVEKMAVRDRQEDDIAVLCIAVPSA